MTHERLMEIIQDDRADIIGRFAILLNVGAERWENHEPVERFTSWIELDGRYDSITRAFAAAQQGLCFTLGHQKVFQFAIAGLYMTEWDDKLLVDRLMFFWDVIDAEKTRVSNFPAAAKVDMEAVPEPSIWKWTAKLYDNVGF